MTVAKPLGTQIASLALGLSALALPSVGRAQSDDPFSGLPNISFSSYPVTGSDADAIRASMNTHRPTDPNDGRAVDALTRWHIAWRLKQDGQGCRVTGAPTFSAHVSLPALSDAQALPADTRKRWTQYDAALRMHEAGHARYAYEHLGDVQGALSAQTCDEANAAGIAAVRTIAKHDVEYDKETDHGRTQGAHLP